MKTARPTIPALLLLDILILTGDHRERLEFRRSTCTGAFERPLLFKLEWVVFSRCLIETVMRISEIGEESIFIELLKFLQSERADLRLAASNAVLSSITDR